MSDDSWTWGDARATEFNLGQAVAESMRGFGLPDEVIEEVLADRESMCESIRPVTRRQIEWQLEEAKRMAIRQGVKIPRLTES